MIKDPWGGKDPWQRDTERQRTDTESVDEQLKWIAEQRVAEMHKRRRVAGLEDDDVPWHLPGNKR